MVTQDQQHRAPSADAPADTLADRTSPEHGPFHSIPPTGLPLEELTPLGWDDYWTEIWISMGFGSGVIPARAWLTHGRYVDVWAGERDLAGYTSGRVLKAAKAAGPLGLVPVSGDWVAMVNPGFQQSPGDRAQILAVLPRKTQLIRRLLERGTPQVLASNIDYMVIVTATTGDYNLRRIERYLVMARDGGVQPIVVLNKIDLDKNWKQFVAEIQEALGPEVPVLGVSAEGRRGLKALSELLQPRKTFALVGSSGVGKSSIINSLARDEWVATGEIRDDGKGRHTTTRRELILMPNGSMLMDSPGIRELLPFEGEKKPEDLEGYEDILALSGGCRFRDCRHVSEPECAVRRALEAGLLDRERFENWQKVSLEMQAARRKFSGVWDSSATTSAKNLNTSRPRRHSESSRLSGKKPPSTTPRKKS